MQVEFAHRQFAHGAFALNFKSISWRVATVPRIAVLSKGNGVLSTGTLRVLACATSLCNRLLIQNKLRLYWRLDNLGIQCGFYTSTAGIISTFDIIAVVESNWLLSIRLTDFAAFYWQCFLVGIRSCSLQ